MTQMDTEAPDLFFLIISKPTEIHILHTSFAHSETRLREMNQPLNWLGVWSVLSNYLHKCWYIYNSVIRNKISLNSNQNT